jgi:hypothetical protein
VQLDAHHVRARVSTRARDVTNRGLRKRTRLEPTRESDPVKQPGRESGPGQLPGRESGPGKTGVSEATFNSVVSEENAEAKGRVRRLIDREPPGSNAAVFRRMATRVVSSAEARVRRQAQREP